MATTAYTHDPDAKLDYEVDWSPWLASGETISTSTWAVDDPALSVDTPPATFTDTTATVWVSSGGVVGKQYRVTNHITTNQGRADDRTVILHVTHR